MPGVDHVTGLLAGGRGRRSMKSIGKMLPIEYDIKDDYFRIL